MTNNRFPPSLSLVRLKLVFEKPKNLGKMPLSEIHLGFFLSGFFLNMKATVLEPSNYPPPKKKGTLPLLFLLLFIVQG